jgi:hypothetical protein
VGAVGAPGGRPRAIIAFEVIGDAVAEPAAVEALRVELLT